jgi:septum formation protein
MRERLVLASASPSRARLLEGAGIRAELEPADIDEGLIKQKFRAAGKGAADCALALAEAKARKVARRRRQAVVFGADQLLVCGGQWLDKPSDIEGARIQLLALRGQSHELATAVVAVRGDEMLWRHVNHPRLAMRLFSEVFLEAYLAAEGAAILGSVGAYRLEGMGIQLFERIEGDYFSILGLPLVELTAFLRDQNLLLS